MNNQKSIHHLNWRPIAVYPQLAVKTGINAAILLQQLHYWMEKSNNNTPNGEKYVYKTYEQWKKELPYISTKNYRTCSNKINRHEINQSGQRNTHSTLFYKIMMKFKKLVDEIELDISGK